MEISLRGKTAIVTGASRGIGKAIAKSFVDAGAQVMLTSRKLDALQAAAKEMDGETDVFAANASARFDKTFQVNLKGPLFWSQAVWNASMQNNPGVILNIASVGGLRAEHGLGVYNLTKAAVIHLTSQLACELGKTRVVGIAPGLVKTLFASVLIENVGDKLASALPTKRLGEPQDIANLALFLCSDLASWITGETYVIDGGAGVRSGTM